MFWIYLSVKKILDTLFDDSWCSLCLPEVHETPELRLADAQ